MGLPAHQRRDEDAPVARTLSLLRRDSSRRRAGHSHEASSTESVPAWFRLTPS
jgi:hypothetical protein